MAVVREDVVKVSFDVDDKPLEQVDNGIDKLVQNTQKMAGSGGIGKLTQGFNSMADAAKKMANTKLTAMKNSLTETKEKLTEGEKGAKGLANAVKNVAKASMNKLVSGLKKVGSGLTSALKTAGKLALKIGSISLKGLTAGVGAGVAALGALGTAAINGYAEYEQLIGGVDTLFKDNASAVVTNANNAYKTAGLSANEYMSTVTSFSASLLQSLGGDTAAAAKQADMAITDMADNANKMGTDMSSIQDAYQGFAKQNYTMLDNLKLGYGGTKEEMQRLLTDAEKLSGQKFDISSYADIVEAIHVVQTEMGITGTTAKEAGSTIQGSFNSMKSAWTNFLTGMADPNQDFDQLVGNLIDSVVTFGDNLIPRIQALAPRLVQGIGQIAQSIIPAIPGLLNSLLPVLVSGALSLVSSLVSTLQANAGQLTSTAVTLFMQLITGFIQMLPQILSIGGQIILQLCSGLAQQLPSIIQMAADMIVSLVDGLVANIDVIINTALQLVTSLCQGLNQALPQLLVAAVKLIFGLIQGIMQNLPTIIQTGLQLVIGLIEGIVQAIPQIAAMIPQLIVTIIQGLFSVDWLQVGWDLIKAIFKGVWDGAVGLVSGLWDGIKGLFTGKSAETGTAGGESLASGLTSTTTTVNTAATGVATSATNGLNGLTTSTYGIGTQANSNLASGITGSSYLPTTAAATTGTATSNAMAGAANTTQYGAAAATNLASGITGSSGTAVSAASSMSNQVSNAASSDVTVKVVGDTSSMSSFTSQIADLVASATTKLQGIPDAFSKAFKQAENATKAALAAVEAAFTSGMTKLVSTASASLQRLVSLGKMGMTAVQFAVSSTSLYSSGVSLMQGLNRGMQSQIPGLIATAIRAAAAIKRATDVELKIHSPSKVMEGSGENAGLGQIKGLRNTIPEMQVAAREVSNASIPYENYTPESGSTYYNSGDSRYTTISPVFNLTISGSQDDRALARKVKRYVSEAIKDTFESLEDKSYQVREA